MAQSEDVQTGHMGDASLKAPRGESKPGLYARLSLLCLSLQVTMRALLLSLLLFVPAFAFAQYLDIGVRPDAEIFELREAIDTGLAELADRDRAILRALYLEGKEKDEICREWNMTDAQFRVVLFRAKERFRRAYNGK